MPFIFSYTLTFDTNGGIDLSSVTKISGTTIDLSGYAAARDGYTFAGWYSDSGLTNMVTNVYLTRNTTVYAGWIKIDTSAPVFFESVHRCCRGQLDL